MKDSFLSSPIVASGTSPALAKQSPCEDQPELQANLTERFNILKFLGTTGNSFCFAALDLATDRPVRLKVLSDDAAVERVQKELFYLEAAAAAKLSHQNITRTTVAEELGGIHFCTIDQSPSAESLRDLLDMRSWLEVDVAVSIALQVADALDYAHRMGVLHLDLNPTKIVIEGDGRVLVTDFGISGDQELAWAQAERSSRHRPQYASPEQIQGSYADNRSDLYSLGIILFEMLTDRVPFDSSDAEVVRRKHLTQAAHPPQLFRQGISNYLSALVVTLLEKNPDWRFSTAAQLQTALSKVAPTGLADEDDGAFPLPEPLSVEEESQSAELDSAGPQTNPDAGAYNISIPPEEYAEITDNTITHREFFEPPTITKIDPPPRISTQPKARVEPPSRGFIEREHAEPFSLYVSTNRSQSKRQALAFLAIMLVILLLISLLGRNYFPGFFLTANTGEQNNLPDTVAGSQVTNPELTNSEPASPGPAEQTTPPETQNQVTQSGLSAGAGLPPAQEKATPSRRRYVRRPAAAKVRQSARRKFRVKRKARKPVYLRRTRAWTQMFDVGDWFKSKEL
ncbi:MAG TPA: serine/threonine-protein kinase [Blastocatellia bacterium]|nr:serine/threonine-protein kinase [Blastocatellia bacterium]